MFVGCLRSFDKLQPGSRERVHLDGLDTKHLRRKRKNILTLRELEAFACFGTTGFLTFNNTRVTGHEAFDAECVLVFGIDLDESTGDGETESLGLAFVTAAVDVDSDVVLLNAIQGFEGLEYDVLEDGGGEVLVEGTTVVVAGDCDGAVAFLDNNAGDGGLTAAYCIN